MAGLSPARFHQSAGGSRSVQARLGEAFLEQLLADFEQHGSGMIERFRTDKPIDYVKIVASFLTKDAGGREGPADPITEVRFTIVEP
jgi:hypothetical protein